MRALRILGLIVLAGAAGCAKKGAMSDSAAPAGAEADEGADGEVEAAEAGDDDGSVGPGLGGIDDYETQLGDLESQLATLGLLPPGQAAGGDAVSEPQPATDAPVAGKAKKESQAGRRDADQCQRICDLAQAMCGLEDQICDLAGRHEGDTRYESACTRAGRDCALASEACNGCSE